MAYTKNTWADGDVVTSEKLNHMEDGIADAGGVMVINDTDGALDKTWQEIHDEFIAGRCIIHKSIVTPLGTWEVSYSVVSVNMTPIPGGTDYSVSHIETTYVCASPNDYPSYSDSD